VIDAYPFEFDEQMACIARHFSVVGMDALRRFVNHGDPLPPNPALITFDDGYLSNHDCALPILKRHGVRAVFFIATHYITERRVFWWDRISYIVKHATTKEIELEYPDTIRLDLEADPGAATRLATVVKQHRELDLDCFLAELAEKTGVSWTSELEHELANELVCTWAQIRELRDAGMDIQSHTRSHRVLRTLSDADLEQELVESKRELEEQMDHPIYALAYPVGLPITDRPRIRNAVAAAGYELGFSNGTGVLPMYRSRDRFDLPRVSFGAQMPHAFFRASLAIPPLAYNFNR
jgi:peptidoglycan/xylan/chitin deacetylase (PgdA/CDA1 family)